MIVGSYYLTLYCDAFGCTETLHTQGTTQAHAILKSREEKWFTALDGTCYCPKHREEYGK